MKKSQSTVNFQGDAWGDPAQCRRVRKRPAPKGLRQTRGRSPAAYKACGRQGQAWPEQAGGLAEGWVPRLLAPPHSSLESCEGPDSTPSPESLLFPSRDTSGGWLSPAPRDRTSLLRATHIGWPEVAQVRGSQAPGWTGPGGWVGWAAWGGERQPGRCGQSRRPPGLQYGGSAGRFFCITGQRGWLTVFVL